MSRILSVGYPLAPVGPDATGGAEQILATLNTGLVERGVQSIVIACERSSVAGELIALPRPAGPLDADAVAEAQRRTRVAIERTLAARDIDLVHMHGVDFASYLPPAGVPVLATLHCPAAWYSREALEPTRADTWFNAVSNSQHATLLPNRRLLPPVPNGVSLEAFSSARRKRPFSLVLARLAPEKGLHLAIEAARRAGVLLLIGGELFAYPEHQRYFREEIAPRLDPMCRWLGPVGLARKRRLLAAAQCLVVASQVPETSSLSAREALASGTPVVAFDRGAMREAVAHGKTGYLVDDVADMAEAIGAAAHLDSQTCRRTAVAQFGAEAMIAGYLETYRNILSMTQRAHRRAEAMS